MFIVKENFFLVPLNLNNYFLTVWRWSKNVAASLAKLSLSGSNRSAREWTRTFIFSDLYSTVYYRSIFCCLLQIYIIASRSPTSLYRKVSISRAWEGGDDWVVGILLNHLETIRGYIGVGVGVGGVRFKYEDYRKQPWGYTAHINNNNQVT